MVSSGSSCLSKKFHLWLCVQAFITMGSSDIIKVPLEVHQCKDTSGHQYLKKLPPANSGSLVLPSYANLNCAVKAKLNKALGYTYHEGNCNLLGPGKGSDCGSIFFGPAELEDVSRGKNLYASPRLNEKFALEFTTDEDMSSFYHSKGFLRPWWLIDIGAITIIHEVQILPRQECCPERFRDIQIRIGDIFKDEGDFSSYDLMFTYDGPYTEEEGRLIFSSKEGFSGKYISIQRDGQKQHVTLEIADVKIFVGI